MLFQTHDETNHLEDELTMRLKSELACRYNLDHVVASKLALDFMELINVSDGDMNSVAYMLQ